MSVCVLTWPAAARRRRLPQVKQRVMWGYKILFLDVLFPLDVPRIVFLDAGRRQSPPPPPTAAAADRCNGAALRHTAWPATR